MFLSRLNPSIRSAQARRDLARAYEMHRTLMRAFPDREQGGPGRVLFRVDVQRDGVACVLIQSEKEPRWSALAADYPAEPVECRPFEPTFTAGQRLLFRLRANPARKTGTSSKAERRAGGPRRNGKRLGLLREEEQLAWLAAKGEQGGFRLAPAAQGPDGRPVWQVRVTPQGFTVGFKGEGEDRRRLTVLAVRFDGLLVVTDPTRFLQTVRSGVGPAKGLGFGLLSLARAGQ